LQKNLRRIPLISLTVFKSQVRKNVYCDNSDEELNRSGNSCNTNGSKNGKKRSRHQVPLIALLLLFTVILLTSCGDGKNLFVPGENYDPYLIEYITIYDNTFEIKALEPVDLEFRYHNVDENEERYKGYSGNDKSALRTFSVPVSGDNILYRMDITVYSETAYKDTLFFFYGKAVDNAFLKVDFVDVAQGDGTLIRTPEGQSIAVDGGYGTYSPGWASEEDWNGLGEPLMLNYVQEAGVDHFSYLIETHRHSDHWGGLQDIIDAGISYDYYLSSQYSLGYQRGDFLNLDSAVSFQILNIGYPPDAIGSGVNNTSIVLRITYGSTEYLLTGDGEREVEQYLLSSGFDLSANVLKAGHHGSQTSSTPAFLNSVLAQFAKIVTLSFGTGNPYGHPHSPMRFKDYETFGTNMPSYSYSGTNFHFDVGTIKTFSDGTVIIVKY